jgi:CheY-like chemotaxis protein
VDIAYNGQWCIERVEKNRPDVIILDFIMPELKGYDACDRLTADEKNKISFKLDVA